jgi:hypothetical protein
MADELALRRIDFGYFVRPVEDLARSLHLHSGDRVRMEA